MIDEQSLEKKFLSLTNSQESIQTLSLWVLHHKNHFKRIIQVWFKILEKDKISHRLTLFYLANDVVQHSKKKGYRQYLDGFQEVLKKATVLVRDEKIAPKITRIFTVWNERSIYPDEFISELRQILRDQNDIGASGRDSYAQSRVPTDFSLNSLERKIKECDTMEKSAKVLLAALNTNKIDKIDGHLVLKLKDKKAGEQCCRELTDIENQLKSAVLALERQANCRTSLVDTLEKCELFYETQKEEVKIVANAYRNFHTRVKAVRSKLSSSATSFPSPYPSPVLDAPSPNSDDDLVLPGNSSPLPGLKSLLNVFNEERNNKVSSLDKRLSNLMQNLPAINQLQMQPKDRDESSSQSVNKCATTSQPSQIPANPLPHQSSGGHQFQNQFSPLVNSQPAICPASVNVPPPTIPPAGMHAPPPFIPAQQPAAVAPMLAGQNYYFPQQPPPLMPPIVNQAHQMHESSPDYHRNHDRSNYNDHHHSQSKSNPKFGGHHSTNSMYSKSSASNSVQPIRSVISSRSEQQPAQQPDRSEPGRLSYDSYGSTSGLNNTMDSFEPTDMDLGNSDDEEMNRSSNSTRVLKVIETSDDSNYSGSTGNLNSSFNKKHSLTSTYGGNNFQPHQPSNPQQHHSNQSNSSATISLTPHLPPPSLNIPPKLSHHIPAKNSNFNLASGNLNPPSLASSLSTPNSSALNAPPSLSANLNTSLNTSLGSSSSLSGGNPHPHYHNGKHQSNSQPYSHPGKSRWPSNNHPLTGGPAALAHSNKASSNQYAGPGLNQSFGSGTNNRQFSSGNSQQFGTGQSNQQSYGSTGGGGGQFGRSNNNFTTNNRMPWKANKSYNPPQNRSQSFGNRTNFGGGNASFNNNNSFSGNFGYANNPPPSSSNLTNLTNLTNPSHQYP